MKRILVTGAFGQIGTELVPALEHTSGVEKVVALGHATLPDDFRGIVEKGDATDRATLERIVSLHEIDTVFHLVSLLSATGEVHPHKAWEVNMTSLKHVLDLAMEHKLRVFWPSSIAAFGPTTPRVNTPQHTVLEPTTMYGVTKVAGELLCQYYWKKFGVDVRSLRYPGLISWKAEPGGGTTDYAVAVFYEALTSGKYEFFVEEDTVLPMMYMDDAVRATIELMKADERKLTVRTSYNLAAISFKASELVEEIAKHVPLQVTYAPDHRQAIADSWPQTIDDSQARNDWGWQHQIDLPTMTLLMLRQLADKLGAAVPDTVTLKK
jgi:nucleoside-diphosphate-sugar epimerase